MIGVGGKGGGGKAELPTINFIDSFTLKAIGELRKILIQHKRTEIMQVEIILSVTIPILILSTCFSLWVYDVDRDLILFLSLVNSPIFLVMCILLYYSARANDGFVVAQRCLHLLELKV